MTPFESLPEEPRCYKCGAFADYGLIVTKRDRKGKVSELRPVCVSCQKALWPELGEGKEKV